MDTNINNPSESLNNITISRRSERINRRRISYQTRLTSLLPTPHRGDKPVTTLQAPNEQRITFFDVPNEIRNMIYHYALVRKHTIYLEEYRAYYHGTPLSFLSTHPKIRSEASPIYYGNNTFQASSTDSARKFLDLLSKDNISSLRHFRVDDPSINPSRLTMRRTNPNIFIHLNLIAFEGKGGLSYDALVLPDYTQTGEWSGWFMLEEMANYDIVGMGDGYWRVKATRRHERICHSSIKCLECFSRLE
jgi:hypothetical protein